MDNKLAIHGGPKMIGHTPVRYNPIGKEEQQAVNKVMESGVLSRFLGVWHDDFFGGDKVRELEQLAATHFDVEHVVSVNSWTSGLIAAVGAIGTRPGDEIIVTPWTMSATAMAPLWWNAIPVFADIEEETFNIDPTSIENNITPFTRAIIAVDIYGHSADMDAINAIAKRYELQVISDSAQSPNAQYKGNFAGTLADIGGFSLNYHKHIHCGEGGLLVTNDSRLAERLQLIRNHAESVVAGKKVTDLSNMIGANYRLGELEAAIAIEQLAKLQQATDQMVTIADALNIGLGRLKGLRLPIVKADCSHVYYAYPLVLDPTTLGVSREVIYNALVAEGVPLGMGYTNIHLLPIFQKKIAYGNDGYPWSSPEYRGNVSYEKGICPVAEHLHDNLLITFPLSLFAWNDEEIDLVISAFQKVWDNLSRLG